jgi:hypothetical protein
VGPLSPRDGASSGCGWRGWPPDMEGSCGQPTRGGPPALGLGVGLTTPYRKKKFVTKCQKGPRTWTDSLNKRSKL